MEILLTQVEIWNIWIVSIPVEKVSCAGLDALIFDPNTRETSKWVSESWNPTWSTSWVQASQWDRLKTKAKRNAISMSEMYRVYLWERMELKETG